MKSSNTHNLHKLNKKVDLEHSWVELPPPRRAFLLRVDGLAFFFFLLSKAKGTLGLVSREKEKVDNT